MRIVVRLPVQEKDACLRGHRDPDLVGQFQAPATLEVLLPDEDLDVFLSGHQALVMVGGHSHVQMLRRYRSSLLINPGSVGLAFERSQSSERNVPWAEYTVLGWDGNRVAVEFRRVPYDVGMLKNAAFNSGMPHVEWFVKKCPG